MITQTKNILGKPKTTQDPRTTGAMALDAFIPWSRAYVPDRIPSGVDPLVLATPSWCSSIASEISRRLVDELGSMPEWRHERGQEHGLDEVLKRLPRELLAFNPDASAIASLCAAIDRKVAHLRAVLDPPAPAPLPAVMLELAADFGITLPADHDAAAHAIASAIARSNHGDRRFAFLFPRFGYLGPEYSESCFLRKALIEGGLPPMRPKSLFERADEQLRPTHPRFRVRDGATSPFPLWYEGFLADHGVKVAPLHLDRATEMEIDREVERRARMPGPDARPNATQWGAAERRRALEQLAGAAEAQRARVVAALDALCATLPISAALWWAAELRRHLAMDPNDRPVATGVAADGVIAMFRLFNLKLSTKDLLP